MAGMINVRSYTNSYLSSIIVEADFLGKKNTTLEPYDADKMAVEFLMQFPHREFTVGQQLTFSFLDKNLLSLVVKDLEVTDIKALKAETQPKPSKTQMGICLPNTTVVFEKAEGSSLNLVEGKIIRQTIFNSDWDLNKMGIGGLDKISVTFRHAFASRFFPSEVVEQLGCKLVKGILLFGLPGTGKTLMARQIREMLNAREPKILSAVNLIDKNVEESEANVCRLFAEAEKEEKRLGPNSGLHIIILDDIDAICRPRGSRDEVQDAIVTQLLAKLDGLNNILVIATTNRKDLLDYALMWPGRLEVQIEIGLPDERGRHQILNIHTARMRENDRLSTDVDTYVLTTLTENFTGAELEALVSAAQSRAYGRFIKVEVDAGKIKVSRSDSDIDSKLKVGRRDFLNALENDIKPAYGTSARLLEHINLGPPVASILDAGSLQQVKSVNKSQFSRRFIGGTAKSSKTAFAAQLAKRSKTVSKIVKLYSEL